MSISIFFSSKYCLLTIKMRKPHKERKGSMAKVSIEKAAKLMNKSQQYLRISLQRGTLPIGNAEKMPGSTRYNYYISPKLFSDYTGIPLKQIEESD